MDARIGTSTRYSSIVWMCATEDFFVGWCEEDLDVKRAMRTSVLELMIPNYTDYAVQRMSAIS